MKLTHHSSPGLLIILAALVVMLSMAVYGLRWWREAGVPRQIYTGPESPQMAESGAGVTRVPAAATWPTPTGQSRGQLWSYGLFTPPEIHFDRTRGTFTVSPLPVTPDNGDSRPADSGQGLQLRAVRREAFVLQLVGYIGDESDLLGAFKNTITGETLLLRVGARIDPPGLVVESLNLVRQEERLPESMSIRETRVRTAVWDMHSGRRTSLEQGVTAYSGRLQAILSTADEGDATVTACEGEVIALGENRYRIEKIRLAPPAVDVTNAGVGPPDRQTLLPVVTNQAP